MDLSRVSVRMRPGALAPASARRWVHQIGPSWGVPLGLLEDAALVAGAMVLHSVRQAGSPLRLTLASSQAMVLIEVEDACTAFPTGYPAAGTRGPGCERLGMDLVKRVAQAYGYTRRPDGRQVWARVVDCAAA